MQYKSGHQALIEAIAKNNAKDSQTKWTELIKQQNNQKEKQR